MAMKLAGTVTDGVKIREQMDKAFKTLPPENNPQEIEGLDAKGGTLANVLMGVVEGGKIKDVSLRSANARSNCPNCQQGRRRECGVNKAASFMRCSFFYA